jgi:hypothetical protein
MTEGPSRWPAYKQRHGWSGSFELAQKQANKFAGKLANNKSAKAWFQVQGTRRQEQEGTAG